MSWFDNLLNFATGFFEGYTEGAVEQYARHAPPGRVYSPHGHDFRRHMLVLAEATGIHLANLNEERRLIPPLLPGGMLFSLGSGR